MANENASTAAMMVDTAERGHGTTATSNPIAAPDNAPPVASPTMKTVQRRKALNRPPPEARSAQALFKPQVDPDRETPEATAAVTNAH